MLNGDLICLREPWESDISLLVSIRNNIDLQIKLMTFPKANTIQRVKDWLTNHLDNPQTVFFIVATKTDNNPCGYIQLVNMDFINSFGELGICLVQSSQGKGYGKDAIQVLEKYVEEIFNIRKIILKVLADNLNAISLYERLGYSKVGCYQKHFYNQGNFSDIVLMEKFLDLSGRC